MATEGIVVGVGAGPVEETLGAQEMKASVRSSERMRGFIQFSFVETGREGEPR